MNCYAKSMFRKKLFVFLLIPFVGTAYADFQTKAKSAFLVDFNSGAEIVVHNADTLMPPSSMIKLMTLAVLFDEIKAGHISMNDRFVVSKNADYQNPFWYPASKICLSAGQDISVRDLIAGIIVLSGGDGAVVVAEKLAGTEDNFTNLMQKKAREIGMPLSTFGNSSGLPNPTNLMTSRELATLAKHIISEYPDIYPMFKEKRFEFSDYKSDWCRDWGKSHTLNYNKLLFIMPGADGLKTGHTNDGGYGMVASANVSGRRLIGVINGFHGSGHDALASEMKKLLNYGYTNTINRVFYDADTEIIKIPTWYGKQEYVIATIDKPFAITFNKDENMDDLRIIAQYDNPIPAPITKGDVIGTLIAQKNGHEVAKTNLIAKEDVNRIRFFSRLFKNISVIINGN